jgi:hypothetical protein
MNGYRRRALSRPGKACTNVADYRAYTIGHDGHFCDYQARSCHGDRDAIEWARHLVTNHAIELWWRFVAKLEPKPERAQ